MGLNEAAPHLVEPVRLFGADQAAGIQHLDLDIGDVLGELDGLLRVADQARPPMRLYWPRAMVVS
jgi:hypothetical protein